LHVLGGNDIEDLAEDIFKEFSIRTFEMFGERESGTLNAEIVKRIIIDKEYRENIRKAMSDEEKKGDLLTKKDMMKTQKNLLMTSRNIIYGLSKKTSKSSKR
jgi:hypothetical protein